MLKNRSEEGVEPLVDVVADLVLGDRLEADLVNFDEAHALERAAASIESRRQVLVIAVRDELFGRREGQQATYDAATKERTPKRFKQLTKRFMNELKVKGEPHRHEHVPEAEL